jgi:hypothetical protein
MSNVHLWGVLSGADYTQMPAGANEIDRKLQSFDLW